MNNLDIFLKRAEQLVARLECLLPDGPVAPTWEAHTAFRWRRRANGGYFQPVPQPHRLRLQDLRQIDRQKAEMERNTRQFLAGRPFNHVLLWGARGTGKSSLIKALLHEYAGRGLRLLEVDRQDLLDLVDLLVPLYGRPERFLLYCDDLSFSADEPGYQTLKALLDGSIIALPDNVMLCVTSNRRHLLPEYLSDNQDTHLVEGELHHGEAVEEKISLSERFGLWLAFHPFSQADYLLIVDYWLQELGQVAGLDGPAREAALRWALARGSRSGRVAWQFARDWVGRQSL